MLTVCIFWGLAIILPGTFWKNDDNSYVYRDVDIAAKISCIDMKNLHKGISLGMCIQKEIIIVTDDLCNIIQTDTSAAAFEEVPALESSLICR